MKQDDSEQTTWSFLADYMGYAKHQNQSNTTVEQQQETNKTSTEHQQNISKATGKIKTTKGVRYGTEKE